MYLFYKEKHDVFIHAKHSSTHRIAQNTNLTLVKFNAKNKRSYTYDYQMSLLDA